MLKPLSLLGAADMDYVASRSLMLSGVFLPATAKAAEAVEKLLKLFAMCEHGIDTGQLAAPQQVKKFGHGIVGLFERMVNRLRADVDPNLLASPDAVWVWEFVQHLQEAYKRRYPDSWAMNMRYSIDDLFKLDAVYTWIRNGVVHNMSPEYQEQARLFGASFASAYTPEVLAAIRSNGALTPFDLLRLHNGKLPELEIRHDLLP